MQLMEVRKTTSFVDWLAGLRDRQAKYLIFARIDRLAQGHLGDSRSV